MSQNYMLAKRAVAETTSLHAEPSCDWLRGAALGKRELVWACRSHRAYLRHSTPKALSSLIIAHAAPSHHHIPPTASKQRPCFHLPHINFDCYNPDASNMKFFATATVVALAAQGTVASSWFGNPGAYMLTGAAATHHAFPDDD